MKADYEAPSKLDNGIISPFTIDTQEGFGNKTMATPHWHDYLEILYCLSGSIKILLSGDLYYCNEGDMILINSKEIHSVTGNSANKNFKYMVLKLDSEMLYSTSNSILESKYTLPFIRPESNHQKVFTANDLAGSPVPELLRNMLTESQSMHYGFELAIHTYICNLFLWILRTWHNKSIKVNMDFNLNIDTVERLQKIFNYVELNYKDSISLESVAEFSNMSYSYLSRFFKSAMNRNFSEYVNFVRITKAEKLLITTNMTVTEIAQETGFSTSSYFIQQFKLYKKVSPKHYRANIRNYV